MPEIAEVETIRRQLLTLFPAQIVAYRSGRFVTTFLEDFFQVNLQQRTICEVSRYGKWLIFVMDHGAFYFLTHLGMSGRWLLGERWLNQSHVHLTVCLAVGSGNLVYLSYQDPRRFGRWLWFRADQFQNWLSRHQAPDVLSHDFDLDYLSWVCLSHAQRILKPTLLDQSLFPGVGNYLASEICHEAGLAPTRPLGSLNHHEIFRLKEAIHSVIDRCLSFGGTSFLGGYRDVNGLLSQSCHLRVFRQPFCRTCFLRRKGKKSPVRVIVQSSRRTFYCPNCQK
ncbi:MAG: hypothetical protein NZ480_08665 [Bdellovibrionaceae bacterium]|nr:hypothetical protein [Pseudobdellovibrionaceae bacterium]MDW8189601.1 DNA-formamidopyrimidine glycosylase family protein [Pseudobdellovibrionaceae bacterium]